MKDATTEMQIVTGMITSTEFLKRIQPFFREDSLQIHNTNKVASWCNEFYKKHQKAPKKHILHIFNRKAKALKPEHRMLIEEFLTNLSERYKALKSFNIDYVLDIAEDYFKQGRIDNLLNKVSTATEKGNVEKAEKLITDYKSPNLVDTEKTFEEGFTAKELKTKQLKEVKWFIDDVIPIGLTLIAGKAKTGKSYFLLNATIDLALGRKAFDAVPTESERVLFLALEEPPQRTKRRLEAILKNEEYPDKLHIQPIGTWPRSGQGGFELLEEWMKQRPDTRLIVIDTLAKWKRPKKAHTSDFDEEYHVMSQLQEFANKHEIAVVVIHHTKKTRGGDVFEEISGGMGIQAGADTLIVMDRVQGKPDHRKCSYRGRDIGEYDKVFEFRKNGRWVLSEEEITEYSRQSKQRKIIQGYVECFAKPTIKRKDLVEELKKNGRIGKGVDVLIKKMVEAGNIEKPETGFYAPRGYAEAVKLDMVMQKVRKQLDREDKNSKPYKGKLN